MKDKDTTLEGIKFLLYTRHRKLGSWKAVAAGLGISQQFVTDLMRGRRAPGPKLLKALGYQAVTIYREVD